MPAIQYWFTGTALGTFLALLAALSTLGYGWYQRRDLASWGPALDAILQPHPFNALPGSVFLTSAGKALNDLR